MGFHLRKSFNLGGIRFNLSNSGIGLSTGIKGLRFGIDGKGRSYIGGGKGILRYRKYVNNKDSNSEEILTIDDVFCGATLLLYMSFIGKILYGLWIVFFTFVSIILMLSDFGHGFLLLLCFAGVPSLIISLLLIPVKYISMMKKGLNSFYDKNYELALFNLLPVVKHYKKNIEASIKLSSIIIKCYEETDEYQKALDFIQEMDLDKIIKLKSNQ